MNKKGFSLLEILLVIAAIGIIASIVVVAINPLRQIGKARDASRYANINTIQKALDQYYIANGRYPIGVSGSYQEICVDGDITDCLDLESDLVPTYIADIPKDPQGGGYRVAINSDNNKVSIAAIKEEYDNIVLNPFYDWKLNKDQSDIFMQSLNNNFNKTSSSVSSAFIGIDLGNDNNKWSKGILAPNGNIYGVPLNSDVILKIDPSNDSISTFGSLSSDLNKWQGGVLAPNGNIYFIPWDSTQILELNPDTELINLFGNLSGTRK